MGGGGGGVKIGDSGKVLILIFVFVGTSLQLIGRIGGKLAFLCLRFQQHYSIYFSLFNSQNFTRRFVLLYHHGKFNLS